MKNLKIGARLGVGFGVVLLLLVVIAIVSVIRLNANSDMTDEIVNDRYVKVLYSNNIKTSVNIGGGYFRNALLARTPEEQKKYLDLMSETVKEISENFGKLEKIINTPTGHERFRAMDEGRKNFIAVRERTLNFLKEGNKEQAIESLFNEAIPAQNAFSSEIDKMIEFQSGLMDKYSDLALDAGRSAAMLVTVLSVIAIVVALAVGIFITGSITRPIGEAVKVAQTVAAGDLSSRIEVRSKDETGQLLQALKNMNDALVNIVAEVRGGTDTIASASQQIATGTADLSSRTEEQASSLEETASSMEELTSTVKQNADNARQANQLAVTASEVATKGGTVVSEVVQTMGSINESAKKIVDIIGVIDGIAFQTNILALNAAVEAARAGEQGRGFAVVASEVRNLAQRSAAAAKEIKELIGNSVEKVDAGSRLVDQAGATMQEVVESIRRVTGIMAEISAASAEQTAGIEQINQAVTQMDEATQQNAALVEQSAAAAEAMREQAGKLAQAVGVFKLNGSLGAAMATTRLEPAAVPAAKKSVLPAKSQAAPLQVKRLAASGTASSGDWEEF